MELKRDELYYLDKLLAHSVTNEYMEFESVFGVRNRNFGFDKNRIKRIDFQRLLKHLHKTYSDSTKSHTFAANQWRFSTNTSLDIWLWRNSSYKYDLRFTIQDVDGGKNVINYCNFNKLSNDRHNIVYKKRYNRNNDEVRELKDIINRGGVKYHPGIVEELLNKHPKIQQSAIAPVPDDILGEKACAYIVSNDNITLDEVCNYLLSEGIAKIKLPEQLKIIDKMPVGPTNKIIKGNL